MQVTLRKENETSGFFSKKTEYVLYVGIKLTEEERDAIKQSGIEDYLIMEYSYKGVELNYFVKTVIYHSDKNSESRFVAPDTVIRNKMEQHIKEQLRALKSHIEEHMGAATDTESYEL